jgi:hypothetical protein
LIKKNHEIPELKIILEVVGGTNFIVKRKPQNPDSATAGQRDDL